MLQQLHSYIVYCCFSILFFISNARETLTSLALLLPWSFYKVICWFIHHVYTLSRFTIYGCHWVTGILALWYHWEAGNCEQATFMFGQIHRPFWLYLCMSQHLLQSTYFSSLNLNLFPLWNLRGWLIVSLSS